MVCFLCMGSFKLTQHNVLSTLFLVEKKISKTKHFNFRSGNRQEFRWHSETNKSKSKIRQCWPRSWQSQRVYKPLVGDSVQRCSKQPECGQSRRQCFNLIERFRIDWGYKMFSDDFKTSWNSKYSNCLFHFQITTNGFSAKKLAKSRSDKSNDYGGSFLKSRSTLHKEASSDGETDEDAEQIVASATTSILTDEDLLKACGGRTAHK